MSFNSKLSDLASQIYNGQQARKLEISCKRSNFCLNVLEKLKSEGYIRGYIKSENNINVLLKYINDKPAIKNIQVLSTSNRKFFIKKNNLLRYNTKNGLGLTLISTPKGILSELEAILDKVGGQIILKVL